MKRLVVNDQRQRQWPFTDMLKKGIGESGKKLVATLDLGPSPEGDEYGVLKNASWPKG